MVDDVDAEFAKRFALPRQGVDLEVVQELSIRVNCVVVIPHLAGVVNADRAEMCLSRELRRSYFNVALIVVNTSLVKYETLGRSSTKD